MVDLRPETLSKLRVKKHAKGHRMLTRRFIIKTCVNLHEERAACLPLIVFIEVTPGLKACRAPLQHRPTTPNMVKMAEGEAVLTARLYRILHCSTQQSVCAHARLVVIVTIFSYQKRAAKTKTSGFRMWIFLVQPPGSAATLMLSDNIAVLLADVTRFLG